MRSRFTTRGRPGRVEPVPVAHHNRVLRAARKDALATEDSLTETLTRIIERAGEVAARNFERRAVSHGLTASLTQTFAADAGDDEGLPTMVAVKPRPEEASELAEEGEHPAENLHVTLAYLGKTTGPLERVADALRTVPSRHAPLSGRVGGIGSFDDNGGGYPSILLPSVPGLAEVRQGVASALADAGIDYGREHGFQPHVTVAYRDGAPATPDAASMGSPLTFDDLWVVRGDTETIRMPLVGASPLTASASVQESLADVAAAHAPDGGYGGTSWRPESGSVMWVCADWSTDDEIDAAIDAFLAVDGVLEVEACDECPVEDGEGWEVVWLPDALTAAAGQTDADFCLPSQLRGKTDPIRAAVVSGVVKASIDGTGIAFDVVSPLIDAQLARTASQIGGISQTTQVDVMRIIREAYDQGYSIPDTAKAIRSRMTEIAPERARLIARTELVGAVNGASLAGTQLVAQATGDTYEKVWLTAPGAKYPRHEDYDGLDGQTTTLDGMFDVGGSSLRFPGDPDGPPDEVCNCRCTLVYSSPQGEGEADAEDAGGLLACGAHGGDAPDPTVELRSLVAALSQPSAATWTAPAPEEVLRVQCGAQGASAAPSVAATIPEAAAQARDDAKNEVARPSASARA